MSSIVVSVRVRPFNSREMKYQSKLIVAMDDGGVTNITQVRQGKLLTSEAPKKFTFDNAFWSHDPASDKFASQQVVYDTLGKSILDNALQGFNGCLFAYGQTGSGKTYTMMGAPSDPGVIPRMCGDLFERTTAPDTKMSVRVECSFLEIYNEQVRDLLNPAGVNKTLKVRQHPTLGVFVEGLKKLSCKTREDIEQLIDDGTKVRSVAATNMNATSSRSHGIITLNLLIKSDETELSSQLHLVDLAGSERANSTGASGETLAEGANINKSLTTLGMCLSRLAEVSAAAPAADAGKKGGGKGKSAGHIPFRDSQLTWLLHDSLGGNSKTAMLANISPADINFDETLSTLRFAQTTKKIKMHAKVNEDPQQKLIRELREEITRIKELIMQREAGIPPERTRARSVKPVHVDPVADVDEEDVAASSAAAADGDAAGATKAANDDDVKAEAGSSDEKAAAETTAEEDAVEEERIVSDEEDDDEQYDEDDVEVQDTEKLMERMCEDVDLIERLHQTEEERAEEDERERVAREAEMKKFVAEYAGIFVDHTKPRLQLLNDNIAQLCPGHETEVQLIYYVEATGPIRSDDDDDDDSSLIVGTASDAWLNLPYANDQMSRYMLSVQFDPATGAIEARNAGTRHGGEACQHVWINGRPVEASTPVQIRHGDRVLCGPFAFRLMVPSSAAAGDAEGDEDAAFDPTARTLGHLEALETYARLQVRADAAVSAADIMRQLRGDADAPTVEGASSSVFPIPDDSRKTDDGDDDDDDDDSGGSDSSAAPLGDTNRSVQRLAASMNELSAEDDELLDLSAIRYELVESERVLCTEYPLTAGAVAEAAAASAAGIAQSDDFFDFDYAKAITERNEHVATTAALQRMAEMKRKEAEQDLEIAQLREELQRRKEERERREAELAEQRHQQQEAVEAVAKAAAAAAAAEATAETAGEASGSDDGAEEPDPEAPTSAAATSSAGRGGGVGAKARWKTALRKVSAVESLKKANPNSRFAAEEKLALAQELQEYEERCRVVQSWQPNGPADPTMHQHYTFALTNPSLEAARARDTVVFEGNIEKLRIKQGFFSRSGYHTVFAVILPHTVFYYEKTLPTSPARGSIYFYGATIVPIGLHEGKHAIRIDPTVPRKAGKVGKENSIVIAMNTKELADGLVELLKRHSLPEASERVRVFLDQQADADRQEEEDRAAEAQRVRHAVSVSADRPPPADDGGDDGGKSSTEP